MLTFNLDISCLNTSNLSWFIDLTFQVPMQYCSLQLWTLLPSPVTSTTGMLWLCLFILFGVISPLISSSILGTYQPGEFIFQCPIFLPFHVVHGVLKARILKWLPVSSLADHVLSDLSTMTCLSWVALPGMGHSFIELDKAVVHVIRLVSFLWLWFSVCLPSDGEGRESEVIDFPWTILIPACGSFLMGETDWGGNWVLFWWAGPCSVNL